MTTISPPPPVPGSPNAEQAAEAELAAVTAPLGLWAVEAACDRHAAKGTAAILHGYAFMIQALARRRAAACARPYGRLRHALATALTWAAGPLHPPVRLRAALTRAAGQYDSPHTPGHDHA